MTVGERRLGFIDTLRGITIISMVGYHLVWDLVHIFHADLPWMYSYAAFCWQQSICWSFILISGFCRSLGHHPVKNGLRTFLLGGLIMAVTLLFMPEERILFGILTFLGSASLLMVPLETVLRKIPCLPGMLFSFLLFLMTRGIQSRYVGFSFLGVKVPDFFYRNYFTAWLGFPFKGFFSTDYFGIIPWFFLYLTGWYFYGIYSVKWREKSYGLPEEKHLSFLGRHSIWLYMLHQPIIYGILSLISTISKP